MSTVNPAAIATHLRRVLGYKDIDWLREQVYGDVRRNIIWALERLCFARESYHDGVFMMARLAVAENEEIGNNATAQLVQLFHIYLAGTEVNLKDRLATLKGLIDERETYIPLTIRCFEAALQNGGFVRIGGAEKFGFENRKDYTPNTWDEIFEYWYGCRDLLLEWINKNPEIVNLLAEMAERKVYNWARTVRKEVFVPLLEKIAELKNYAWDTGYEALFQMVHTFGIDAKSLGIAGLMEKMRNQSFKMQLNEARYIQHGQYRLKDKEQIELSEKLYAPLAAEFIDKEIYANTEEVKALLSLITKYPQINFSIKMRLGWEDPEECLKLAPIINELPLRQVVMHPRLGKQQYKGEVDLKAFEAFQHVCKHPLIYNGDINHIEDIHRIQEQFPGLAGMMIGRGLLANPALAWEYQQNRTLEFDEMKEKIQSMHTYVYEEYIEQLKGGDLQILNKMKAFWEYLLPNADRKLLKAIHKSTNLHKYTQAVHAFFNQR